MSDRPRIRDRQSTSIRLPAELLTRLRQEADDRDLSVNYLVTKAVAEFLDRLIPADEFRLTRPRRSLTPEPKED